MSDLPLIPELPVLFSHVADPGELHDFGEFFEVEELGMVMKRIEPGSYHKGIDDKKPERAPERPRHRVHVTRRLWMGIYPVTQEEYKEIIGKNPSMFQGSYCPTGMNANRLPAEKISWSSAVEFCEKLTRREKAAGRLPDPYVYRLPTEAEWEYICRGGSEDDFVDDVDNIAWYYKNANESAHEVGLKEPNDWGFYDMQGNIWEWVLDGCDFHDPTYYEAGGYLLSCSRDDVINPYSKNGTNRIAKGGCWLYNWTDCRPSSRFVNPPDSRYFVLGFRVVLAENPVASLPPIV